MRFLPIALIFLLSLSLGVNAFVIGSSNYKIVGTIDDGGGKLTSTNYIVATAVAQPIIGRISTQIIGGKSNYHLCLGIFCVGLYDVPHYVTVSGTVYYDTGDVVSNGDVILVVKSGQASYKSATAHTNANGVFTAKVYIPEDIANTNFKIQTFIKGRVDTSYECTFDQTNGYCR